MQMLARELRSLLEHTSSSQYSPSSSLEESQVSKFVRKQSLKESFLLSLISTTLWNKASMTSRSRKTASTITTKFSYRSKLWYRTLTLVMRMQFLDTEAAARKLSRRAQNWNLKPSLWALHFTIWFLSHSPKTSEEISLLKARNSIRSMNRRDRRKPLVLPFRRLSNFSPIRTNNQQSSKTLSRSRKTGMFSPTLRLLSRIRHHRSRLR